MRYLAAIGQIKPRTDLKFLKFILIFYKMLHQKHEKFSSMKRNSIFRTRRARAYSWPIWSNDFKFGIWTWSRMKENIHVWWCFAGRTAFKSLQYSSCCYMYFIRSEWSWTALRFLFFRFSSTEISKVGYKRKWYRPTTFHQQIKVTFHKVQVPYIKYVTRM